MGNGFTLHRELQAAADRREADLVAKLRGASDCLAADSNDNVSFLDPCMFRRRSAGDVRD